MARGRHRRADGWTHALAKSLLILGVSALGFLVVPDILARELSEVATPAVGDAVVLCWTLACMFATSWLLVRVQRGRSPSAR